MSDIEIRSLNGYKLIDETARLEIEEIKINGVGSKVGQPGTGVGAEIFNDYEGNVASGEKSHAEGSLTEASGNSSHTEGIGTIAIQEAQHVQGKFNIPDNIEPHYTHIVGNGTSHTERSNAHTLDWEGNAWYSGDVYVGSTSGTNKDEGSKKLATHEYVDEEITRIKTLSSDPRENSDENPELSAVPINADMLGGVDASEYAKKSDLEEISGLPNGGTTGQVLTKASDVNQDVAWQDLTGGGMQFELLWENNDPSSSFAEGTVYISPPDETTMFLVELHPSVHVFVRIGQEAYASSVSYYNGGSVLMSRIFFADRTYIYFSNAYIAINTTTMTMDNSRTVPLRIYAVKEVNV